MSNPIPEELRRWIEVYGASVAGTREIDYGTQYRIVRGPEAATLNVYTTGKVAVQGPRSGLKDLLQSWKDAREQRRREWAVGGASGSSGVNGPASSGSSASGRKRSSARRHCASSRSTPRARERTRAWISGRVDGHLWPAQPAGDTPDVEHAAEQRAGMADDAEAVHAVPAVGLVLSLAETEIRVLRA